MTITRANLDPRFKFQVAERPGGAVFAKCFECGSCTGICPMSEAEPDFDPRKVLHMIRLGLKSQLLGSQAIWYCNHCDTCTFACPQGIDFSTVIGILREISIEEGYSDSLGFHRWGTSPCKSSCPAHISIHGFIGAIARGKYAEGLKLIKKDLPFPGICGRVCPHPCELKCSRADIDRPTAIMALKRFLADMDLASPFPFVPEKSSPKEEKVAVVGSGPAGLTVAYYLSIAGYPVTIFEKLPVAGGMMAVGIPEYRLPRKILQAEIHVLEKLGVEMRLNCEVGKDIEVENIRQNFQAIFIGVGCQRGTKLGIRGEDQFEGSIDGIAFLREANLGNFRAGHGRLIVIGGGNAAIDCARVARRIGFDDVTILYRRSRDELPASPWEVQDAFEEGIRIEFLTAPIEILGRGGRVTGVKCIQMRLGDPDKSGRRRPIPVDGSEFIVQADYVVPAIGQVSDLSFLFGDVHLDISKQNLIRTDPQTAATSIPGVFAGGDVVLGPATVVEAVAFGKRAALAIDHYLRGEDPAVLQSEAWQGVQWIPHRPVPMEREVMPRLFLGERKRSFKEIDLGFTEEQALLEASRCLRFCGMQKRRFASDQGEL